MLREEYAAEIGRDFSFALIMFLANCEASGIKNIDYTLLTSMGITTDPEKLVRGSKEMLKISRRVKNKKWQPRLQNRDEVSDLFSQAASDISTVLQKEAILEQIGKGKGNLTWNRLLELKNLLVKIGEINT